MWANEVLEGLRTLGMQSGEVEMSDRKVISRHLFSCKQFGLLTQFEENNSFGRPFTWPCQIRWVQRWCLDCPAGKQRLEQTSRAFSHWKCLILEPCAVFRWWFIFRWREEWFNNWGFYQMKLMECPNSHFSLFGWLRVKRSDVQSFQTKTCCFQECSCLLFYMSRGFYIFSIWRKVGRSRRTSQTSGPISLSESPHRAFDLALQAKLEIPTNLPAGKITFHLPNFLMQFLTCLSSTATLQCQRNALVWPLRFQRLVKE